MDSRFKHAGMTVIGSGRCRKRGKKGGYCMLVYNRKSTIIVTSTYFHGTHKLVLWAL
ncbi:hypothetical protein ACFL6G_06610 [candidate division KSB1 bacterium]